MRIHNATLVVIEFGASWPRWLDPSHSGDMAVVAQHYEGAPTSLITQVATRVTRLEGMGWKLKHVILVSNGRCDVESAAARSVLARGLLARLRAQGRGRLMLSADQRLGKRATNQLLAIASAITEEATLGGIDLAVHGAGSDSEASYLPDEFVAEAS
jgi:hypothetical protein